MGRKVRWLRGAFSALLAASSLSLPAQAVERGPTRVAAAATQDVAAAARVIVKFRSGAKILSAATASGAGPQRATTLGARLGLALRDGRPLGARTQLVFAAGLESAALAARIAAEADVEWAVPDRRRHALATPNDPLYPDGLTGTTPAAGQWEMRAPDATFVSAIDAAGAWNLTTGSADIVVAVLDTGVRPEHPDLAGKLLPGYDFVSADSDGGFVTANDGNGRDGDPSDPGDWVTDAEAGHGVLKDCDAADSSWHGTQVAGLVGAATNNGIGMAGVGWNVMVLPVRVLGKCGGYDSDIIDAMRWSAGLAVSGVPANGHPARVINLSLGSSDSCSSAYADAVADVTAIGVAVVAAAGNEGLAVDTPANCAGVVAVAGVRHTGTKVGYSSLGPQVAISAPAGNCVNDEGTCLYPLLTTSNTGATRPVASTYTDGNRDPSLGTSFSTPLVSGTIALMLSVNADLTPTQATQKLKASARSFPRPSGVAVCTAPTATAQDECACTTSTCGAGLLDAAAAVASADDVTPVISASTSTPAVGATVDLDGSGSTVAAGRTVVGYAWSFASGSTIAAFTSATDAATTTVVPNAPGRFSVRLVVTDSEGATGSTTKSFTAAVAPPTAVITYEPTSPNDGDTIHLGSSGSEASPGATIASYQWAITSGATVATLSGATDESTAMALTNAEGDFVVQLTVTDSAGNKTVASQTIHVDDGGGSGGGALEPAWSFGLLGAILLLRGGGRRRRIR